MNHNIVLCYKNFSKDCNVSHQGLGISGAYTAKTLIANGYNAVALPAFDAKDLTKYIESKESSHRPVTHVLVMAQWMPTADLALLARRFPSIHFGLNCHSGVGFLQAEPNAIKLVRQAIDLEYSMSNFTACANNHRLADALTKMYNSPVTYLPNLYYLHGQEPINRPLYNGGTLRIGCFGSHRVYKNFSTAIAASIELASRMKVQAEIWINAGRHDGAGNIVYNTAKAWTDNVPHVQLKELHWCTWPEFRRFVGTMNLLMQPSYTETFNVVTADGIAAGTPSVVSDTIEWCPESWFANSDDSSEVAKVGRRLLTDHHAPQEGYDHLKQYVEKGLHKWKAFVERPY